MGRHRLGHLRRRSPYVHELAEAHDGKLAEAHDGYLAGKLALLVVDIGVVRIRGHHRQEWCSREV
ncbi:hypothetical protein EJB05_01140, partial [Eragrostis curvula]